MSEEIEHEQNGIPTNAASVLYLRSVEEDPPNVPNNKGGEQEKKTRRKKKSRREPKQEAKTDADDTRQAGDGTVVDENEWFAVVSGSDLVQVSNLLSHGVDVNCVNEVEIFVCIFYVQFDVFSILKSNLYHPATDLFDDPTITCPVCVKHDA